MYFPDRYRRTLRRAIRKGNIVATTASELSVVVKGHLRTMRSRATSESTAPSREINMNVYVPTLRWPSILLGTLLIAATLSACSDSTMPEEDTAKATPSTQVQDASRMSLDDYLAICAGPTSGPIEVELTLAGFATVLGEFTEQLEAVEPPEEVAAWHKAVLVYQRALKEALDDAPGPGEGESEAEYILGVLFPVGLQHQPEITEAINGMDRDLVARMLEAGCIDDEFAGESAPQIDAAVLTVGESIEAMVDNPDVPNRYSFQAEQGGRYVIEVARQSLPDFVVTLPVTEAQLPQNFILSDGEEKLSLRWEASTSDTYFFQVIGDGVGSYTVAVQLDLSPGSPSNVRYAVEGSTIRVTWDAVDGAGYYIVFHSRTFDSCSSDIYGNAVWCNELATNISETTYVQTRPGQLENHYWVAACNSEGCSNIADSAATPPEVRPSAPTNVRHDLEGSSIRIRWDTVDGADYYKVYHGDVLRDIGCTLNWDGRPVFCEELAGNVADTTYVHTDPDSRNNYYWVVACNSGGCSDIDSENPAIALETSSTGPAGKATPTPVPTLSPAPTPSATPTPTQTPTPSDTPIPSLTSAPTASDSANMTVVEYAQWCAGLPDDIDPATWGEFLETVKPSLDEAEVLTPPMALTDLHDAVLLFLRGLSSSASRFDADAPYDMTMVLVHGLAYVAQIEEMKDDWNDDVRAALVASGCVGSEIFGEEGSSDDDTHGDTSTATSTETPIETAPAAPANVRYAMEGSAIRISWDPVAGADHYNVYHDDFFDDACRLNRDGSPSFCEELATGVETTSYVHTSPNRGENYYWVVACDSSGCSDVDSENPATSLVAKPGQPANVRAAVEGSAIRVSWDPLEGADNYNVYHFASPSDRPPPCLLSRDGTPRGCEELATSVGETTYVHAAPDSHNNYYWVVACNSGGCSEIDSDNPARQFGPESTGSTAASVPGADRAALLALYNAMDGANWRQNRNWLSEQPIRRWYGVDTDRDGRVTALDLSGNGLSGELPKELGSLSNLVELDLSFNRLSGEIPVELGNLSNLEELLLRGEQGQDADGTWLSGEIPPELGKLSNLRDLDLSWNELTGEIPEELGSLKELQRLYLRNNQLTGPVPAELGSLPKLFHLRLSRNDLLGEIPSELGKLTNLRILDLDNNQLSGAMPPVLGTLTNLKIFAPTR